MSAALASESLRSTLSGPTGAGTRCRQADVREADLPQSNGAASASARICTPLHKMLTHQDLLGGHVLQAFEFSACSQFQVCLHRAARGPRVGFNAYVRTRDSGGRCPWPRRRRALANGPPSYARSVGALGDGPACAPPENRRACCRSVSIGAGSPNRLPWNTWQP
jgi:hypothetical protein